MRVLTNRLDKEISRLLRQRWVSEVDIATAWATEGSALVALEKARTQRPLKVRTLAGFAGNHTTPGALERLAKLGKVRLVDGRAGLFHVKLLLFRGSLKSLAWVGSANFTGPGFKDNEELLCETEETDELQDWFNRRWKAIGSQPNQPAAYCKKWKKPAFRREEVDYGGRQQDQGEVGERHAAPMKKGAGDGKTVIVIKPDEEQGRPPPRVSGTNKRRYHSRGEVIIGEERHPYKSAGDCLKVVLETLQRRDRNFLKRCRADERFRGVSRHIVGRRLKDLGSENAQRNAKPMVDGWWLCQQTQTQEKWKFILAAAEIAGMSVQEGTTWQAEGVAKAEVGF